MGRNNRTQTPWDYDCPYKGSCLHPQWSSTRWIFSEYQHSYDEHCEHWRIRDLLEEKPAQARAQIEPLEQQNAQLKAKLRIIHQRQFKANKKTKKVTSDKRPDKKQKKKRGAPKGHPDWSRPTPDHIDKTIDVPATVMNFDRQATRNGSSIYDDLKEKLRSAASAYCDETFWRQDGVNHYVWYASNNDLDLFHIDRHRSADVAQHQ